MPDGFPCPNPTCTQTFSPDAVKRSSGVLTCPRCGTVYQFRQPEAAKPKPPAPAKAAPPPPLPVAPPVAKPVARAARTPPPPPPIAPAVAVAPAVTQDVPVAPAVKAEHEPDRRLRVESSPEMVTSPSRRRHRGGGWVQLGIVAGVVLAICGAAGYGIYWVMKNSKPPEYHNDNTPAVLETEGNFSFDAPPGWKPD